MTTASIDPYPWFLNRHLELTVNDLPLATRITSTEWTDRWRPLLGRIYELHHQYPQRLLIAIGGPPGSGKSVFAEQLHWVIDKGFLPGCYSVALPMDGFHYPNEYLQSHYRTLPNGVQVPLMDVKGSPDTFDAARLKKYLQALREPRRELFWPGYSRQRHDVTAGAYQITPSINVIFVEGNYLLVDRPPFAGIPELFHLRIYLDSPAASIISNLMQRHMAGGRTMEIAKEWVKRIDLPNARIVEATRANADVVVERSTDDDIVALHWKGTPPPKE